MVGFFFIFGLINIVLFHHGIYLPITVSVAAGLLATVYMVSLYRCNRIGPLAILLFLVYALPFLHVIPYLWFNFDGQPFALMWGLMANPYMFDKAIIKVMAMIGAVGAAGLVCGTVVISKRRRIEAPESRRNASSLQMGSFFCFLALAIFFSYLAAPESTIIAKRYTESESLSSTWNFGSAWLIGCVFLVFALADSVFEPSAVTAKWKLILILIVGVLVVFWFQLLRGERAVLPFLFAAILMRYRWGKNILAERTKNSRWLTLRMVAFAVIIVGVSFVVGRLRHLLVGVRNIPEVFQVLADSLDDGSFGSGQLLSGTWSAVLLTPLSIAGDYLHGSLSAPKYGLTYLEFAASILPGFVADWMGYVRPIDALKGPAWEMTYGLGGTHAVVVPFLSFRMAGVFFVIALWSFVFVNIERYSMRNLTSQKLAFLGTIATITPHWLWYGEKYLITALITWGIAAILFNVCIPVRIRTVRHLYSQ